MRTGVCPNVRRTIRWPPSETALRISSQESLSRAYFPVFCPVDTAAPLGHIVFPILPSPNIKMSFLLLAERWIGKDSARTAAGESEGELELTRTSTGSELKSLILGKN